MVMRFTKLSSNAFRETTPFSWLVFQHLQTFTHAKQRQNDLESKLGAKARHFLKPRLRHNGTYQKRVTALKLDFVFFYCFFAVKT